jgi:hypothetical protein
VVERTCARRLLMLVTLRALLSQPKREQLAAAIHSPLIVTGHFAFSA